MKKSEAMDLYEGLNEISPQMIEEAGNYKKTASVDIRYKKSNNVKKIIAAGLVAAAAVTAVLGVRGLKPSVTGNGNQSSNQPASEQTGFKIAHVMNVYAAGLDDTSECIFSNDEKNAGVSGVVAGISSQAGDSSVMGQVMAGINVMGEDISKIKYSITGNDSDVTYNLARMKEVDKDSPEYQTSSEKFRKQTENGYAYYSREVENSTAKRLDIENNMRQAVSTGIDEFVVFYQPVVNVNTQMCTSCEALVRWDSKALGFMGPGEFIPLAEYLGLITSIGDYVLEEACRRCKLWNDNGHPDFYINVNLSVVQLLQKNVVENIKRILDKTGVNPKNIVLEITESFAINDMQRVMDIITGLKKLGPRIALDDFGTGYSSLNYIKQLPLDIIKVDKTFIDDIIEDDYAQAFVKLIVDLSKTIGTKIVVEGVEHKEQFELLKSLGVDYIQGYYFGKPVPANIFEEKNLEGRLGE